jgi:hypothetical protein
VADATRAKQPAADTDFESLLMRLAAGRQKFVST